MMLHQEFLKCYLNKLKSVPKRNEPFSVKKLSCVVKFLDLTKRAQTSYNITIVLCFILVKQGQHEP